MRSPFKIVVDDFGIASNINNGILNLVKNNLIDEVSVLMNYIDTFRTGYLELERSNVEVSLHLNFTEGIPLALKKKSLLVKSDGSFRCGPLGLLALSIFRFPKVQNDVYEELRAQVESFQKHFPSRKLKINGHQHVHVFPVIREAIMQYSVANEIDGVRIPRETTIPKLNKNVFVAYILKLGVLKQLLLLGLSNKFISLYKDRQLLHYNKHFIGVALSGHPDKVNILRSARMLTKNEPRPNPIEVLFHPGLTRKEAFEPFGKCKYAKFYRSEQREIEFELIVEMFG